MNDTDDIIARMKKKLRLPVNDLHEGLPKPENKKINLSGKPVDIYVTPPPKSASIDPSKDSHMETFEKLPDFLKNKEGIEFKKPVPKQFEPKKPTPKMTCDVYLMEGSPLILHLVSLTTLSWRKALNNFGSVNFRVECMNEATTTLRVLQQALRIDIHEDARKIHKLCDDLCNDMVTANLQNSVEKAEAVHKTLMKMTEQWTDVVAKVPKPRVSIVSENDEGIELGKMMSWPTVDNAFDDALRRSVTLMDRAKKVLATDPDFKLNGAFGREKDALERKMYRAIHPILTEYAKDLEKKAKDEMVLFSLAYRMEKDAYKKLETAINNMGNV